MRFWETAQRFPFCLRLAKQTAPRAFFEDTLEISSLPCEILQRTRVLCINAHLQQLCFAFTICHGNSARQLK